ncbi:MAG: maltokinase N-terminal cap-like domain-containing protein [Myxococcales bacterium]
MLEAPNLESVFSDRGLLEAALPAWIEGRRWFTSRQRELTEVRVRDVVSFGSLHLVLVRVSFNLGETEDYIVPLALENAERGALLRERAPQAIVAGIRAAGRGDEPSCWLFDPLVDATSATLALEALKSGRTARGAVGVVSTSLRRELPGTSLEAKLVRGDHRYAAVSYGDQLLLKVYRRLGEGVSPELELGRYLAERAPQAPVPPLLGSIEYRTGRGEPVTLATLHGFVPSEGTGWNFAREELRRFYQNALASRQEVRPPPRPVARLLDLAAMEPPPVARELFASTLAAARLLGKRTAELHLAFAAGTQEGLGLDPYSALDQRSTYQTKRNLTGRVLRELKLRGPKLSGKMAELSQQLVSRADVLYKRFEPLLQHRLTAQRCRIHGRYHLGKLLYTGKDFVVLDFEGDSSKPLPERRRRRAALRDVASMIRSLEYAAQTALRDEAIVRAADRGAAEPWAKLWMAWVPASMLSAYLEATAGSPIVPKEQAETELLLDTLLLELALDDVYTELDRRTDWAMIALRSLNEMLEK